MLCQFCHNEGCRPEIQPPNGYLCMVMQRDSLRRRVAELEAERDRMRPVVDAAVAEYRAANDANDEEQPDDTQVLRNGRWAKTEAALRMAIFAYLAATPKEPR